MQESNQRGIYTRYRVTCFPLTATSKSTIETVAQIERRWGSGQEGSSSATGTDPVRVGLFYGGSRGNPGAGGSGNDWVELATSKKELRPDWAAATALGSRTTTNNVAESIGLHRLLARAIEKQWQGVHVVGDSALILGLMERRQMLKTRKRQHWYRTPRRMADICGVVNCTHHY